MRSSTTNMRALVVALLLIVASCSSSSDDSVASDQAEPTQNAAATDRPANSAGSADDAAASSADVDSDAAVQATGEVAQPGAADDAQERPGDCSFTTEDSTPTVLRALEADLTIVGDGELASQVGDLAASLEGSEPAGAELVQLASVLPQVRDALAEGSHAGCVPILQSALGRLGVSVLTDESADAADSPVAGDDLEAVLQRGFQLSADDAACVSGQLGEVTDITTVDDVDVLVALSACSNQS